MDGKIAELRYFRSARQDTYKSVGKLFKNKDSGIIPPEILIHEV